MALVFLLHGCRTETINEENNRYSHEVTKALYDMQKVPQFSSFISRAKSKKENSKNSLSVVNDKSKVLVITKPDITSYSTLVRNADSGFEILVYSVDKNGKESFYKAKYIPENKTVNNKIENFTGKVEFSNETDELLQTVRYSNGVVVNTNEKTNVSSKSSPCHYYVTITAVRCTAGDGHAPGEACSGTADQQPYYDVYVSQYCNQEQDAGGFTTGSGSYGETGEYGSYGGGFNALELIMNNTDAYHWNLFNQLSADNRTKIYELLMYNAIDGSMYNFMISFFNQNPTTTVQQFQSWFLEPPTPQDITNQLQAYPCAQSIAQQLPTLSNDIATAMRNVFQNNENYHIIFKAKSGLGDVDGETFASTSNTGTFKAVINLNDQILTKSTKEYILVTMYHEVIHAFLDYEKFRLGDSAFNNQYPSVLVGYDYDANGNIVNRYTFLPNHGQLGAFLSQLENIISTYNPNLPIATVKAIAKAGITTTTQQEKQLNLNERDTTTNNHKGTKCQ